MIFLEFEKELESLYEQLEKIKDVGEGGVIDVSDKIKELEKKIASAKKVIQFFLLLVPLHYWPLHLHCIRSLPQKLRSQFLAGIWKKCLYNHV